MVGPQLKEEPRRVVTVGLYHGVMSAIVHLPDDLAGRLAAEAARRGVSIDELSAELVAAGLPADTPSAPEPDALQAFIGSGDSGDPSWAGSDTALLRAEAAARRAG